MARDKGARGEREIVAILQATADEVLGPGRMRIQRNSLQSDRGGCDIAGVAWMGAEVKRGETPAIAAWWSQTLRQCGDTGKQPVLFWRTNNRAWKVRMRAAVWAGTGYLSMDVDIDLPTFLRYFAQMLTCVRG